MASLVANVLHEFWLVTAEMAPYLLLGFAIAGLLSAFVSPRLVERHLGSRGFSSVVKASVFGVPLPLCSCGVIPVGASLRQHGASRGATTSFLLSTPQTGVDSILVTYSMLGPLYAIFRPLAALLTGIVGGVIVGRGETDTVTERRAAELESEACTDGCEPAPQAERSVVGALRYGFVSLPRDIGKSLILGLVIAAGIGAFVPADFAGELGQGLTGMLAMLIVGIPLYVCATGSVPIAAALILKGISPGAALVFLMTGPATNAATLTTVWKILGRRAALTYLGIVAGSALLFGTLLDLAFDATAFSPVGHAHEMEPGWFSQGSAVLLIGLLGYALLRKAPPRGSEELEMGTSKRISIEGMNCGHCVSSVERALRESDGVDDVRVSLDEGSALVSGSALVDERLQKAIEGLGFKVTKIEAAT